ncbi:cobalt ECF transporter T component CbiQ [Zavarzinia compransoris]|uniref:cobalt ECF transporter T component CbiQ n=1 Tax=Zavarzinia marina TaxID=2911065 RepID=UPI001F45EF0F|nr:cobalt ECF transporter T component CbiQ [Zavarzinia marina]MCF4167401.1 cobalt ECF transporter T component CbiQ [Zavarzinia marina]
MGHVLSPGERALKAPGAGGVRVLGGVDPRARILGAVLFAVVTVSCNRIPVLVLALAFAVGAMVLAGLAPRRTLKRMATMDGFIIFMLVLLPFTVKGQALFTLWGFEASREGMMQAVTIGLKANAVILALMVLVGTMEPVTLGHALHRLRVPAPLVHLLLFTVRYVEVLHAEYLRLRQAMKARGFRPGNSLHTWRSFGYLIGMMLVRAVERSERILGAMKCRGFTGAIPLLAHLSFTRRDGVFALVLGGIAASLVALESTHVLL